MKLWGCIARSRSSFLLLLKHNYFYLGTCTVVFWRLVLVQVATRPLTHTCKSFLVLHRLPSPPLPSSPLLSHPPSLTPFLHFPPFSIPLFFFVHCRLPPPPPSGALSEPTPPPATAACVLCVNAAAVAAVGGPVTPREAGVVDAVEGKVSLAGVGPDIVSPYSVLAHDLDALLAADDTVV